MANISYKCAKSLPYKQHLHTYTLRRCTTCENQWTSEILQGFKCIVIFLSPVDIKINQSYVTVTYAYCIIVWKWTLTYIRMFIFKSIQKKADVLLLVTHPANILCLYYANRMLHCAKQTIYRTSVQRNNCNIFYKGSCRIFVIPPPLSSNSSLLICCRPLSVPSYQSALRYVSLHLSRSSSFNLSLSHCCLYLPISPICFCFF